MKNEEIKEMIRMYNIKMVNGNLSVNHANAKAIEEIKAAKSEIIAYIEGEKKAYEDRQNKIAAIEGLKEIESLNNQWSTYHEAFEKMMSTGSSKMTISCPTTKVSDLLAKYPRAAAFRKAQNSADADNYKKAAAGRKALEKIINNEDPEKAIADMETEWSECCSEN